MDKSILEKITKLLALGDASKNDSENEREIAMRHAHALLAKHGLSMADVSESERVESTGALGRTEIEIGRHVWQSGVYGQIAKLHSCAAIRSARRGKQTVWFVGRNLHCQIAKNMAAYVVLSIVMQAGREGHNVKDFGTGAWSGVREQVDGILDSMARGQINGEQVSTGTALVLVDQHQKALVEANATLRTFWPNTTTSSSYRSSGGEGYRSGKAFGRSVGLNQQVGGSRLRLS